MKVKLIFSVFYMLHITIQKVNNLFKLQFEYICEFNIKPTKSVIPSQTEKTKTAGGKTALESSLHSS